ncbi:MAG: exosortase A [Pseudomonadota bacterium]
MAEDRVLSPTIVVAVAAALLAAVAAVFWPTFRGMVAIWGQSDTFSYGYLVLPMAFWSLWQSAQRLGDIAWRPSWLGILAVFPSAGAWYVGEAVGVQAVAQYGMVGLFIAGCWAILGNAAAWRLRFGLLFTLFAVPIGEFMIPWLMDVTADFTVAAVHLTGIPVYRTERFFMLPSGNFEVVEACSGIRFLIVTMVLATWYAQQTYVSIWRKLAFIAMAGVVMNIANGVRAFIIVLLVHYSEGAIGVGYDHIVYGWVVFIISLLLIVKLGSLFRESEVRQAPLGGALRLGNARGVAGAAAVVLAALVGVRTGEAMMTASMTGKPLGDLRMPAAASGWSGPDEIQLAFAPAYQAPDQAQAARYSGVGGAVEVHQFKYSVESEIIRYDNRLFDGDDFRLISSDEREIELADASRLRLQRRVIERDGERLLMLSWFDIGGRLTNSRIEAKLYSALRSVIGGRPSDLMTAVVKVTDDAHDDALLADYVRAHFETLRECARIQSQVTSCADEAASQARR